MVAMITSTIGGLDTVHDVILRVWTDLNLCGFLTRPALATIDTFLSLDEHVIYAILHEPLYCQGKASNWSAERLLKEHQKFSHKSNDGEIYFTGEMIYRDMFDDYVELRELKEVAEILAKTDDWPALYDEQQLRENEVPVYSATYIHDSE